MLTVQVFLAVLQFVPFSFGNDYYYWRDFTGTIPKDAILGGQNIYGEDTFIGQAYVQGAGIYVAQLYEGQREFDVPCYGVKTVYYNVKILCTEFPEIFSWIPTTSKTFESDVHNVSLVIGGNDQIPNEVLNIGRIFYQGDVIVGDVTPYKSRKGNVQLWYPYKKVERAANFYQLLIYEPFPIYDIDLRASQQSPHFLINVTMSQNNTEHM